MCKRRLNIRELTAQELDPVKGGRAGDNYDITGEEVKP